MSLKLDPQTAASSPVENWGEIKSAEGGKMEARGREVWVSPDERIGTGIWECAAGTFRARFADRGEFIHVVSGSMTALVFPNVDAFRELPAKLEAHPVPAPATLG